jgi:hypothetical protein
LLGPGFLLRLHSALSPCPLPLPPPPRAPTAGRLQGITVAEVTGSNVVSVAEHVVMMILALVRNYIPAYTQVSAPAALCAPAAGA